jgi:hypothetical protein
MRAGQSAKSVAAARIGTTLLITPVNVEHCATYSAPCVLRSDTVQSVSQRIQSGGVGRHQEYLTCFSAVLDEAVRTKVRTSAPARRADLDSGDFRDSRQFTVPGTA